jgi:hypothetical protein
LLPTRGVAVAVMVAAGLLMAVAACGTQATTAAARATSLRAVPAASTAAAAAPAYGPRAPDASCQAALRAQHTLEVSQVRDNANVTALDADFTKFANALTSDAGHETSSAAAKAMTSLANDYTALVQSQTGNAQLPAMATVQADGAAFTRVCGA